MEKTNLPIILLRGIIVLPYAELKIDLIDELDTKTDELNSIYKSISEFILLFVSLFHLYNSWTKIKIQNN